MENRNELRRVSVCTLLLVLGYSLAYNIISVSMTPIVESFSLSGAEQGLMSSMLSFGSVLPLFIIPLLQGRVKKTVMLIVSSLLQVAMLALTGFSQTFALLLTACVLLGAGNYFTDTCANAFLVDLHPGNSTRYLGLLHGFYGIGGLLTPFLFRFISGFAGWRGAYYISALIFAAIIAAFALMSRTKGGVTEQRAAQEQKLTKAMLVSYFSDRRSLFLLACAMFYAASQIGLTNWVAHYMVVRFDNVRLGDLCVSSYWICCAVCRLFSPSLPFKPSKMLIVGALGGALFHALGVISGSAALMPVATGLVGLLSGVCIPVLISEAAIGNEDKTSLTTSATFLIMAAARIVMPVAMGAVSNSSFTAAMLLPAASLFISGIFAVLALRVRH